MSDLKLLSKTMMEFSDTMGDHHYQAAKAIEKLAKLEATSTQPSFENKLKMLKLEMKRNRVNPIIIKNLNNLIEVIK